MSTWTFADAQTGLFVGRTFSGPRESIAANTPEGLIAVEGIHDHLCCRVDLKSGEIINYIPAAPSADYEWNGRRWIEKPAVLEGRLKWEAAIAGIHEIELSQPRALRELALGKEGARERLQAIEDSIAELRKDL